MIKSLRLAALAKDGSTVKRPSAKLKEIIPILQDFSLSWLEFVVDNVPGGAREIAEQLGITLDPSSVLGGYFSNYEDAGEVLGVTIPLIRFAAGTVDPSPVLIYVTKNRVISIHDESVERLLRLSTYSDQFMRKLPSAPDDWVDRQTLLFARIIDEISERNYDTLRLIVERAQTIEIELTSEKRPIKMVTLELSKMKRAILTFLTAVWATFTTVHSLRNGDPEMITDRQEFLTKFDIILADLDRQIQLAEHVLEVLSAGMNVVQTDVANRLSTIILWLSVIGTAVLVPNTLATIFAIIPNAGSLFAELMIIIIISTIGASLVSYMAASRILGGRTMQRNFESDH